MLYLTCLNNGLLCNNDPLTNSIVVFFYLNDRFFFIYFL